MQHDAADRVSEAAAAPPEESRATDAIANYWSRAAHDVLTALATRPDGLTTEEARQRLDRFGPNQLARGGRSELALLARESTSPITLLLVGASILAIFLRDVTDAVIILVIVAASGALSFWQERSASSAVARLLALVQTRARVLRDGTQVQVPVEAVVPGDVVILSAGAAVPGDCLLLDSRDLFATEAALTGETFPAAKNPGVIEESAPLSRRSNALFMGTYVVSGTGRALVVHTGVATELGRIQRRLGRPPEETEFERGVHHFGMLLVEITTIMVAALFALNVALGRPVFDSLLFALAIAVGLTPQLLPAIIAINLARGAQRMAERHVIVRRLSSMENFGSMDVLCTDKTGTLTEGRIHVHGALNPEGEPSARVALAARLNAAFQSGYSNPIDIAVLEDIDADISAYGKLDEIPYDFVRKRLTVLVQGPSGGLLVSKGAVTNILDVCSTVRLHDRLSDIAPARDQLEATFERFSAQGYRMLGVAERTVESRLITREDERELTFLGFLVLYDPPKQDVTETIAALHELGISLKMISGDNALVARTVAQQIGLDDPRVVTGVDLQSVSPDAMSRFAADVDVFAEVEPNQKEHIIRALRGAGHVVGYIGDGINDAPALRAADVGLSVMEAVDVAKESADLVLRTPDLGVLLEGVREGRRTFANTIKYVFMATSANFGNMFSMSGASIILPFLPLLPTQILLTNLLTDLPETAISTDAVDTELIARPRRWDTGFIRRFMLFFGVLSSVFDFATFGVLRGLLGAGADEFRTGWFTESVVSAALIVLVVRTRRAAVQSRPSRPLAAATAGVVLAALAFPWTPLAFPFGFVRLPWHFLLAVALIVSAYMISAELLKRVFYGRET